MIRTRSLQDMRRPRAAGGAVLLFCVSMMIPPLTTQAAAPAASDAAAASLPHMQRTGDVTQLIVDAKPFLILGGELGNSTASSAEALGPVWPRLRRLHLNTVLAPVYWELTERKEGTFDFN